MYIIHLKTTFENSLIVRHNFNIIKRKCIFDMYDEFYQLIKIYGLANITANVSNFQFKL